MKRLLTLLCALTAAGLLASAQSARVVTNFDRDWRFIQGDPSGAVKTVLEPETAAE